MSGASARNPGARNPATVGLMWGALLDASIVASFDARGFKRHQRRFADPELAIDLSGRCYAITGANSGIGYAAALALAERGGRVYLLCRNPERGADAVARIRAAVPEADCHLRVLDASSHAAIAAFASNFAEARLDGLILNAGVLPHERAETAEGLEVTFATNVLGGFWLLDAMRSRLAAANGRVVHVSSGGMYLKKLDLRDWQWRERPFDGVAAYALSKRAQVVLTELWHEELAPEGILVHAMHPGWVDTPSVKTALPGFYRSRKKTLRTPAQGADTAVWLAIAPAGTETGGGFWFDRERKNPYRVPFTRESASVRKKLWELCRTAAPSS